MSRVVTGALCGQFLAASASRRCDRPNQRTKTWVGRSASCPSLSSLVLVIITACLSNRALAADPYADQIVNYTPGTGASPFYADPQTALGEPSRFTPDVSYPSVVSMVSPPFLGSQIVQLGAGGSLTVHFDEPIANKAANPYGVDLIVFGNSLFAADYPSGRIANPASLFGDGTGKVEVSSDGVNFYEVPGVLADRLFPTQGYTDAEPFSTTPGLNPTDFRMPVNPALQLSDFDGLTFAQALALYNGSGGGTPVDIAAALTAGGQPAGLISVSYVRISNIGGAPLEIDAFSTVPEPASLGLLTMALAFGLRRSRRV